MTAAAASPDTPTDPRALAHEVAVDAARTFARGISADMWASIRLATETARVVVNTLADAGLLSLSGDSTQGDSGRADAIAAQIREYLAGGWEIPFDARKFLCQAVDLLSSGSLRSRASGTPATAPRLRRSGSPWVLRAHTWTDGRQAPTHTIGNQTVPADGEHHRGHLLPAAEFDELVVGRWLHVEQMDNHTWWMNIGGVTVHVTADRDGRPTKVRVDGPEDYDTPREGCEYSLNWTGTPAQTGEET